MHNAVLVQNPKSPHYLGEIDECCFLRECSMFSEEDFKVAPIAILIDEVIIIGSFEHVYISDDMRGGFQIGEDIDLVESSLLKFGTLLKFVSVHHFYGNLLLRLHVEGLENGGVGSLPYFNLQVIVLNDLSHN